jgi:hypothetical protein
MDPDISTYLKDVAKFVKFCKENNLLKEGCEALKDTKCVDNTKTKYN